MSDPAEARRRWLGVFCLALAAGMLIWGQTVLESKLTGTWFLLYWFVCFVLTIGAIIVALWDIRALRRRTRDEQQELIERTLEDLPKPPEDRPDAGSG